MTGIKTASRIIFITAMFIGICGCNRFREVDISDIHVSIRQTAIDNINLDLIYNEAKGRISIILPSAYSGGISYKGSLSDLSDMKGKIGIRFVQSHDFLLWKLNYQCNARVNTDTATMRLTCGDGTQYYLNIEPIEYIGDRDVKHVFVLADQEIRHNGLKDDTIVEIVQTHTNTWEVACMDPKTGRWRCNFLIQDGVITNPTLK
jgi:hypothetical protein